MTHEDDLDPYVYYLYEYDVLKPSYVGPPLTKPPSHYLTGYEGSPCDKPEPIRCGKFKYQMIGVDMGEGDQAVVVERDENGEFTQIDLDEFKKQCEEIERGES